MATDPARPAEQVKQAFEGAEARYAKAMEQLVARNSFGELLALVAGNAVAVAKIGSDAADLMVRNLRLAGRRDVVALHRQLARTEDKLERVLQEVETLQDEVRREAASANGAARGARGKAAKRA